MSNSIERKLELALNKRNAQNNLRSLPSQNDLIDFCSNDYLGLSKSGTLQKNIDELMANNIGEVGATGSRLISGNSNDFEATEKMLAQIFKGENALIFNSGYTANLGVLSSVPKRGDVIFYDELSHASIKDGIRLSMAKKIMFRHNDLDDLERKLKREIAVNRFIVVESVYSMDGDVCPLSEIVDISKKYGAEIILDEAHSTGTIGKIGAGMAVECELETAIFARIYTFGKAMGVHGACVVGSNTLIRFLINFSRSFIFTTALPNHSVVAIQAAFSTLKNNMIWQNELNEKINHFIHYYKSHFGNSLKRTNSTSAIQSILIPGNSTVIKVAGYLRNNGYDVRPIKYPTVQEGKERIRICLHRDNTIAQIEGMLEMLKTAVK